jgi:hypothetical protein
VSLEHRGEPPQRSTPSHPRAHSGI